MGSTENFSLTFNQTQVRSGGAHTNATTQQPSSGGGGGGGGAPSGPAGGGLTGTYPSPGLSGAAVLAGGAVVAVALTMANMKSQTWLLGASPTADGQLVQLLGYGYRDDGGGGLFEWNSSSTVGDDTGTIIQITGVATGRLFRTNVGTYQTAYKRSVTLDIRWFGGQAGNNGCVSSTGAATDNGVILANAVAAIQNSLTYTNGTVYFPAGYYSFNTAVNIACGGQAIVLKGDGLATQLVAALTSPGTNAFIEISGGTSCGLLDLSLLFAAGSQSPLGGLYFHGNTYGVVRGVQINNFIASNANIAGAQAVLVNNTEIHFHENFITGNNPGCPALLFNGGSGLVVNNSFYTSANLPCVVVTAANSLQYCNNFHQGGGPWLKYAGAAVTGAGGSITFACAGHTYVVGDWLVVTGAANSSYNGIWKITSVVAATSVTVAVAYISNDTATIASEWSCLLVQAGPSSLVTECTFQFLLCNTSGAPANGSCGMLIDAFHNAGSGCKCQGFIMQNLFMDYGQTAVHLYGKTVVDPSSSCANILIDTLRPNGGPKDTFGSLRIEGCTTVTASNPQFFPGFSGAPTGEYDSIVISDGGQAFPTQDITITGGSATNKNSSALWPGATIVAVTLDGANVHNVSIVNLGVDAAQTVMQLVNRSGTGVATLANGNTMLYGNNAGRLTLIDSTRAIPGGNL